MSRARGVVLLATLTAGCASVDTRTLPRMGANETVPATGSVIREGDDSRGGNL